MDQVYAEISTLKKLNHPHIVKLFEVYDTETSDKLCMVLEFLSGGALMPDLPTQETMDEDRARKYFVHTFLAIEYLHHQKIIHRDIKPRNLLLRPDKKTVQICDLGSACFVQQGSPLTAYICSR